jgi:hypothetical protein
MNQTADDSFDAVGGRLCPKDITVPGQARERAFRQVAGSLSREALIPHVYTNAVLRAVRTIPVDWLAVVAMGFSLSVAIAAPTKPDFSGRWVIEPAPATSGSGAGAARTAATLVRGDMGSGWGPDITITQDANRLTVEYSFFTRYDMQAPLRFVYALDGSETINSVMMGRGVQKQPSKTVWDGDKLVITTVHGFAHPTTGKMMTAELKQTLSVESPASLVVETMRPGILGGPSSTTRTIYKKR